MGFHIKKVLACLLNMLGITDILLYWERKRYGNQYIRIINYHDTTEEGVPNFRNQVLWLKRHYQNVNFRKFEDFLQQCPLPGNMPGIMLTFDDGLLGNYLCAKDVLEDLGMTGYFMVSADLIGTEGYMTLEQLKDLISRGHIIGCHTSTHHRMNITDSQEVLEYEIVHAKEKLERLLGVRITIFCWCGGEECTYTQKAQRVIEVSGYKYGFMTNSKPVTEKTDKFHIQRVNVEDSWSIALMKFQICGLMDYKFRKKRDRVDILTRTKKDK